MKLLGFIKWIKTSLVNEVDIDLKTVKLFVEIFTNHLSIKEYKKHMIDLHIIKSITTKQISIDKNIKDNNIKILEKEFDKLNGTKKI